MSRAMIPWIILTLTVLMDIYGFSAVKHLFQTNSNKSKWIAVTIYWGMTAYVILFFIYTMAANLRENSTPTTRFMLGIVLGIFVSKLFLSIMLLSQDLWRGISWIISYFQPHKVPSGRREFLEKISLGLAAVPLMAFVYGMIKTAYDYQIFKIKVPIKNLPSGLEGLRIVQISDIHSGSFGETEPIKEAVKKINALEPDIFVFTGDLVNNKSKEYPNFIEIFREIKAKLGQFSVLGNHDYGDYARWNNEEEKIKNFETLKSYHEQTNWKLLLNEHIEIDHQGEKLALLGVENWSATRGFPKYGNLAAAYQGTEHIATKVLLSHDPSHWDAEIRSKYSDIQLTLSGHTHGMQFGVETKWFKFSPVQWVYEQWAGLYTKGEQHIYVNRGFGFIGYPGRVGIRPEITLIELTKG